MLLLKKQCHWPEINKQQMYFSKTSLKPSVIFNKAFAETEKCSTRSFQSKALILEIYFPLKILPSIRLPVFKK